MICGNNQEGHRYKCLGLTGSEFDQRRLVKGDCEYSIVGDRVEKDRETGQGLAKSKLPMTETNFMKNSTFTDIAKRQITPSGQI
jgi:hypothetical protein